MSGDRFSDDFNEHSKMLRGMRRQQDFDDLQAEMSGINNGRQARFLNAGSASDQAQEESRRAQERENADMFYLALMREQQFGGYIASEVFDGKSDWQIFDIVAQIETKTGLSFEDYAADILGAEAAQRLPDETDESYNRRVLKLLAEEMLNADGSIKARYADDPLAEIIRNDDAYKQIMEDVAHINMNGPSEAADKIVTAHKEAGYASAELSAEHIAHDPYKTDLRDGQNGHRDSSTFSSELNAESDGFFDGDNPIANTPTLPKNG